MSGVAAGARSPVSAALVAELRENARQHGVLVWLDKDETYNAVVDALARGEIEFSFPILGYRGSFLELMLALDGKADGVAQQPLVVHMPGFNEDEVAGTPIYELYRSGRRYRVALPTLIRSAAEQKLPPAMIEAFLDEGVTSLAVADERLAALLEGGNRGEDLPISSASQLFDDLAGAGVISSRLKDGPTLDAIWGFLDKTLGLDEIRRSGHGALETAEQLLFLMSSYALCVEFVHDLRRQPMETFLTPITKLSASTVKASRELAAHIRERHAALYRRHADEVEAGLRRETSDATADDLGRIDTFRFEDKKVFRAALSALQDEAWERAARYAEDRTEARSFWVGQDPLRRSAWSLVRLAANLGHASSENDDLLDGARDLEEAAARYADGGFEVDHIQRALEQARENPSLMQLEEFPLLRPCLDGMRVVYRRWADRQAVAFNALCEKHGFLPSLELQQRTLFDDVVRPWAEEGRVVAYFLVDALRFEMGQELARRLGTETGSRIQVKPRYAELPTLTEVGMNVLAPVSRDGRLQPDINAKGIRGFRVGEARVATPDARRKAMHERVGGDTCPKFTLEELLDADAESVRRSLARARLVMVHSEGLDKSGEKGVGLRHFEDELHRLRAAWSLLREAGVNHFVMTADHGFLLQDETTRKPLRRGRKTDPKRRHVIEKNSAERDGEVRVSSTDLHYEGEETQFVFPENTMPFDTGDRKKYFLHGGNSLQERVIPVITAEYRHAKGGTAVQYRIEATAEAGIMGNHRIRGLVTHASQAGLAFGAPKEVELRLSALDGVGVEVELVDAPAARLQAGAVVAPVGTPFEVLFRVTGPESLRTQVEVGAAGGGEEVSPCVLEQRFSVDVVGEARAVVGETTAVGPGEWLGELPEGGVRAVFEHIVRFGAVNEEDATGMLGSPRQFRRFSQNFEKYAQLAPFEVRIDVSSGQKRYVREGG